MLHYKNYNKRHLAASVRSSREDAGPGFEPNSGYNSKSILEPEIWDDRHLIYMDFPL